MASKYTRKHQTKWTHRKDWVLDGIADSIKGHAERRGVSYGKMKCILSPSKKQPPRSPEWPTVEKVCPVCQRGFFRSHPSQKWCSLECKTPKPKPRFVRSKKPKLPPRIKVCKGCSIEFTAPMRRYCTPKCQEKYEEKRYKARRNERLGRYPGWHVTEESGQCECGSDLPIPRPITQKLCAPCRKRGSRAQRTKDHAREWARKKANPELRLRGLLTGRLAELCRKIGIQKKNSILTYLGCTPLEFKAHIESQFLPGMTWENRGVFGWHVDHHIPLRGL